LNLLLSAEHTTWCFCKDLLIASAMIKLHSNGIPSEALIMAMRRTDWRKDKKGVLVDRITATDFNTEAAEAADAAAATVGSHTNKAEDYLTRDTDVYGDEEDDLLDNTPPISGGGVCDIFKWCRSPPPATLNTHHNNKSSFVIPPPPTIPTKPRGGFKRNGSKGSQLDEEGGRGSL
jgi:hypothetical protein